jgi:hypothetical protein
LDLWRWIFYINLPVGGAALIYLLATLHVPAKKVSHKVDYLGGALLAVATTALILLATWGGTQYAWASAQIIGLGLVTVVAGVAFCVETKAAEPMLPLHVFRNRNFSLSMGADRPHRPGQVRCDDLPPALPADGAGRIADRERPAADADDGRFHHRIHAGRIDGHEDRQVKAAPDPGRGAADRRHDPADQARRRHHPADHRPLLRRDRHGLGFLMQMVSLISQNSVQQRDMGVASSARMFFQQIGGSIGVAAFGAVFASRLTGSLRAVAGPGVHIGTGRRRAARPGYGRQAARAVQARCVLRHRARGPGRVRLGSARRGTHLPGVLLIKEVPLRGRTPSQGAGKAASQQPELAS